MLRRVKPTTRLPRQVDYPRRFQFDFSARKPGPGGYGGVEAYDGLTPLHLACAAGQDEVVQCLVENNVKINAQVNTAILFPCFACSQVGLD